MSFAFYAILTPVARVLLQQCVPHVDFRNDFLLLYIFLSKKRLLSITFVRHTCPEIVSKDVFIINSCFSFPCTFHVTVCGVLHP